MSTPSPQPNWTQGETFVRGALVGGFRLLGELDGPLLELRRCQPCDVRWCLPVPIVGILNLPARRRCESDAEPRNVMENCCGYFVVAGREASQRQGLDVSCRAACMILASPRRHDACSNPNSESGAQADETARVKLRAPGQRCPSGSVDRSPDGVNGTFHCRTGANSLRGQDV